jgi:hypothetical protein
MARTRPLIAASILLASLVVLMSAACDSETADPQESPQPWRFQSQIAPYAIEVPGQWRQTPSEKINQFADLVLTVDGRFAVGEPFRLIVIPQQLPQYEDVASPDARALKRASLSLLRKRVDQFEIQREGPLDLGGEPALSVFAEGMDGDEPVQYITTYATHGEFGYQIVAWGPRKQQEGLVQAVDILLSGWEFTDSAGSSENDKAQASPDDSKELDAIDPLAQEPAQP